MYTVYCVQIQIQSMAVCMLFVAFYFWRWCWCRTDVHRKPSHRRIWTEICTDKRSLGRCPILVFDKVTESQWQIDANLQHQRTNKVSQTKPQIAVPDISWSLVENHHVSQSTLKIRNLFESYIQIMRLMWPETFFKAAGCHCQNCHVQGDQPSMSTLEVCSSRSS